MIFQNGKIIDVNVYQTTEIRDSQGLYLDNTLNIPLYSPNISIVNI